MWRILAPIIILGIVYWLIKKALRPQQKRTQNFAEKGEELVQDPVCKCYVPKTQAFKVEFKGRMLFFCSRECHQKFVAEKALPRS
jgi:YHS domain-containing protein